MFKVSKSQALLHSRTGVDGRYYQFPTINDGTTVAYAVFTGEHGERTIGKKSRIYYILKGRAKFLINKKVFELNAGDIIAIPAFGTYNLWPLDNKKLEVLLYMEYLDFDKLPK